jgi:hypothetical protein
MDTDITLLSSNTSTATTVVSDPLDDLYQRENEVYNELDKHAKIYRLRERNDELQATIRDARARQRSSAWCAPLLVWWIDTAILAFTLPFFILTGLGLSIAIVAIAETGSTIHGFAIALVVLWSCTLALLVVNIVLLFARRRHIGPLFT